MLRWLVEVETAVLTPQLSSLPDVTEAFAAYQPSLHTYLKREIDGGVNGRTLLRLAALWHDVGKKESQTIDENGRIRFLGHDVVGAKIAEKQPASSRLQQSSH
ncbi:MAG: HDIG domain-containing protein [Chloroflexi bacterium]|nr:HDIG domain-containing protein [Chloroflexota bacterium]